MANGEGDGPGGPAQGEPDNERRLSEEVEVQRQQLNRAHASEQAIRARLQDLQQSTDRRVAEAARAAAADARKAAEKLAADAEVAKEAAEKELADAKVAKEAAEKGLTEAQREAVRAKEDLEKDNAANTLLKAAHAAQRGLYDFVRDSLSDILTGVDAAAAEARCRQLEEGLGESGFISPSSVGAPVGGSRESVVEFDVAVVAGNQQMSGRETDVGGNVQVKAKMSVLPLGLEAGLSARRETRSEDRSELSHHNRIRFSVPVVLASHGDPVE